MLKSGSTAVSIFVGYTTDTYNNITISNKNLNAVAQALSGKPFMTANDNQATSANAQAFLAEISTQIETVSKMRSDFGAIQNRLEHTIDNLDNVVENVTAAESRIRDTDMADEMVKYSKNNILQQAGQSMLAQANQSTQGVLSLLQ